MPSTPQGSALSTTARTISSGTTRTTLATCNPPGAQLSRWTNRAACMHGRVSDGARGARLRRPPGRDTGHCRGPRDPRPPRSATPLPRTLHRSSAVGQHCSPCLQTSATWCRWCQTTKQCHPRPHTSVSSTKPASISTLRPPTPVPAYRRADSVVRDVSDQPETLHRPRHCSRGQDRGSVQVAGNLRFVLGAAQNTTRRPGAAGILACGRARGIAHTKCARVTAIVPSTQATPNEVQPGTVQS